MCTAHFTEGNCRCRLAWASCCIPDLLPTTVPAYLFQIWGQYCSRAPNNECYAGRMSIIRRHKPLKSSSQESFYYLWHATQQRCSCFFTYDGRSRTCTGTMRNGTFTRKFEFCNGMAPVRQSECMAESECSIACVSVP